MNDPSGGKNAVPRARNQTFLPASMARVAPYAAIVLGIFAIAMIWAGAFAHIARERAQDERAALQNAGNLVRAFEEQIVRSLRAADQALIYFRDNYEKNDGQVDVGLWSRPYRSLDDFVFQVAVIGRDGTLHASNIESSEKVNLSDREHFRVHAERDADELFISKPLVGRVSGRTTIQMTRPIRRRDGTFGGVMVLSIDPDYFIHFYESIDLGSKGSITLIGTDGIVRAHGSNERKPIGYSIEGGRLLREFAKSKSGTFLARSRSDGVERYVNYRGVKGYPLIVSVDLASDDVFAWFYRTRLLRILAACFLTAVLVPSILLIVSYQRGLARARDAAEAGTRARTEFLAMMSHELRTPMNAVLGLSSTLLEGKLDPEQRRAATALHESGDNLLRILNDILDFSRLESGRIALEAIPFSPAAVAENAVKVVAPQAAAKGLALRVEPASDLPAVLKGDPGRLRQVVLNLLANAVKFTERGAVTLAIRCLACDGKSATLEWSVSDTGIGIPQDRIGAIFDNFVQVDSSVTRRYGGSGLGLAICRRIVNEMGGTIAVRSVPGDGSVFSFIVTMPLASAVPDAVPAPADAIVRLKAHIQSLGRPLRLLLAEDNPTNQLVTRAMLREFDIEMTVAPDGAAAVRAEREKAFDLILMDVQMPEMNGIEATRAIRGRSPRLPVIALTANAYPEDVRSCLDAGMNGFIPKPVRKVALADAILKALEPAHAKMPVPVMGSPHARENAPLLDRSIVDEFAAEVGAGPAARLLLTYLSETERRLAILRGLSPEEGEEIHLQAHTLKGSSSIFGLPRLAALAQALERHASVLTAQELSSHLDGLEATYEASKEALTLYLERTTASPPMADSERIAGADPAADSSIQNTISHTI